MVLELMKKYKEQLLYVFFGGVTTLVNILTFGVCYEGMHLSNMISNILAWVLAVLVAFITNKLWVFDSKSMDMKVVLYEVATFFGCRAATGGLDLAIMFVSVDCLAWNAMIMKILSNIIVIIANYIASKLIIFKKK